MFAVTKLGHVLDGRFRIESKIGEGGMGVVLGARHIGLGHRVAIKLMRADADPVWRRRFVREARAASRIESDHVARVFDVGLAEDGAPFLTMEYLEGRDLAAVMDEGPIPIDDALTYGIHACRALQAAHDLGIVHRDVKPANLFVVTRDDGTPCVKLLDFGISKQRAEVGTLTGTHAVLGSPQFMSPEQLASCRDVDHRADIWSLGATLFELLTREHVFAGDSLAELCTSIMRDAPRQLEQFRPEAPMELSFIIERCLQKDPDQRFQSAAELEALLVALRDVPLSLRPTMLAPPPPSATVVMSHAELAELDETPLPSVRPVVTTARPHNRQPPTNRRRRWSRIAVASTLGLSCFALALEPKAPPVAATPPVALAPEPPQKITLPPTSEPPAEPPQEAAPTPSQMAPSAFSDSGKISAKHKEAIQAQVAKARAALEAGELGKARTHAHAALGRLRGVGIRPNEGVSSLGARVSLLRGEIEGIALERLLRAPIRRADAKKMVPKIERQMMKAFLAYQQVRRWGVASFYRCAVVESAALQLAVGRAFTDGRAHADSDEDAEWMVKAAAAWLRKARKGYRTALRVPAETVLCIDAARDGLRATDELLASLPR